MAGMTLPFSGDGDAQSRGPRTQHERRNEQEHDEDGPERERAFEHLLRASDEEALVDLGNIVTPKAMLTAVEMTYCGE